MPELFYIDEKKHIFKYFDFDNNQILAKQINYQKQMIPMFAGIGNVDRRIFLFGGKDTLTREITNKSYELVQN